MSTNQQTEYIVRSEQGFSELEKKMKDMKIVNVECFPLEEDPEVFKKMGATDTKGKLSTLMKLTMENNRGIQQEKIEFDGAFDKPLSFPDDYSLICLLCPYNGASYPNKILVDGDSIHTTKIEASGYHVEKGDSQYVFQISEIPKQMMKFTNKSLYYGMERLDRVYAIKKISKKTPFDKTNKKHIETLQNFLQNKITKIEKLNNNVKSIREEIKKELNGGDLDDIINMSDKCKKMLESLNASEKIKLIEEQMKAVAKKKEDAEKEMDDLNNQLQSLKKIEK